MAKKVIRPRALPALRRAAKEVEGHRVIQKKLEKLGIEPDEEGLRSLSSLTDDQKLDLLVDHLLFSITLRYEDEDRAQRRSREVEDLINDFDPDPAP
jgi:hypothetical protein